MIIFKIVENYVFGVFTSIGFSLELPNSHVYDPDSFVFSMRRAGETKCHCFRPKNPAHAFSFDDELGISFGVNELVIKNNFDVSHAFLGDSYEKPKGCSQGEKHDFLGGFKKKAYNIFEKANLNSI